MTVGEALALVATGEGLKSHQGPNWHRQWDDAKNRFGTAIQRHTGKTINVSPATADIGTDAEAVAQELRALIQGP